MSWKEYEAVGDSTLYGGPREGVVKSVLSRIAYLIRDQRATPTCPIGWSNPGEAYLSGWTGFSERAVRSAIARLVADEIIYVRVHRAANGWRKNRYSLNMEKIEAARRPDVAHELEAERQALSASVDSTPEQGDKPKAVNASGHRRSRTGPQALKSEATGAQRLLAVELSSGLAVGKKQFEKSPSHSNRPASQDHFVETQGDPVNPSRDSVPNPAEGTSRPRTPRQLIPGNAAAQPLTPAPAAPRCQCGMTLIDGFCPNCAPRHEYRRTKEGCDCLLCGDSAYDEETPYCTGKVGAV